MIREMIGTEMLNKCISLTYYTTVTGLETKNPIYGIEIKKRTKEEEEVKTAYHLSHCRELVVDIARFLLQNKVTPMCMLHIIDERMTMYETAVQSAV